jgi:hypothetical protein
MPEPLSFPQVITAAIAILAVVISLVSLHRTGRVQRQQMKLQTKQEELTDLQLQSLRRQEKAPQASPQEKADVRVDLERQGNNSKFVITNWGRVAARNVAFDVRPKEGKSSPLVKGDYDEKLPIPELAPGGRCPLHAALTVGTGTVFDASWSWRNPDGSEDRRASLLAV